MCGSAKGFHEVTEVLKVELSSSSDTQILSELCSTSCAYFTKPTASAKERKMFLGIVTTSNMSDDLCVTSC